MTIDLQNKLAENHNQADIATDSESDEEHVHGENCDHGDHGASNFSHVTNRNEKKAREILAKLGMKPIPGIERVTLKRAKNMIFAISEPEVYRIGPEYIVFGEAKMEDPAMQAAAFANQRQAAGQAASSVTGGSGSRASKPQEADEEDDGVEVDATGLEEKDILIVMDQGNVSRTKAIQTLRATKGDIVNAIMELSL